MQLVANLIIRVLLNFFISCFFFFTLKLSKMCEDSCLFFQWLILGHSIYLLNIWSNIKVYPSQRHDYSPMTKYKLLLIGINEWSWDTGPKKPKHATISNKQAKPDNYSQWNTHTTVFLLIHTTINVDVSKNDTQNAITHSYTVNPFIFTKWIWKQDRTSRGGKHVVM